MSRNRSPGAPGVYLRGETWWIRYRGPRPDGSWGLIRESSGSSDARAAASRELANAGVFGFGNQSFRKRRWTIDV